MAESNKTIIVMKIKYLFTFSLLLILCTSNASAQNEKESFYAFLKDGSPVNNLDDAFYFAHVNKENDTTFICRYYQKEGPMIRQETYFDANLKISNGFFAWYNSAGELDSTGIYFHGMKNKNWYFNFNDKGKAELVEIYEDNKLEKQVDFKNGKVTYNDGHQIPFGSLDTINSIRDLNPSTIDLPPKFKSGDLKGWISYLSSNIQTPRRFMKIVGPGNKDWVGVQFHIDVNGKVSSVFIYRSREWSVDMEAIRVVRKSPDWVPAIQGGYKVPYIHRLKITFQVND